MAIRTQKLRLFLSKNMSMRFLNEPTVYILQCLIEAMRSIYTLSFGPCAANLARAALLRNHYLSLCADEKSNKSVKDKDGTFAGW